MKKAVEFLLGLVLLLSLCGSGLAFASDLDTADEEGFVYEDVFAGDLVSSNAEPAEDGQNPVMNFIGVYHCDGARLLIEAEGAENARITVVWDNNGENARWFMSGKFDPEDLNVCYQDCVKSICRYQEGDEAAAEEDVYFNGHGFFFFDYEHNTITWQDDQEHVADGIVFRG